MSKRRKKRKPLGKPLQLSDEDLDRLAQVTPEDIERAAEAWRDTVKGDAKTLLDADDEELEEDG